MANIRLWSPDQDQPFDVAGRHVDPARRTVTSGGKTVTVEPRVLAVLLKLAETPNEPVRRDALIDAVWSGSPGAESSLSNAVSLLRQALADRGSNADRLVRTVPKFGYCLAAEPRPLPDTHAAAEVAVSSASRGGFVSQLRRHGLFVAVAAFAGVFALGLARTDRTALVADSTAEAKPFVAVVQIEADESARPLAHTLVRDASSLLGRSGRYRVADASETYEVGTGALTTDITIAATLMTSESGLSAEVRWINGLTGDVMTVRRLSNEAGSALTLRRAWLEAVVVETALALGQLGRFRTDSDPLSTDGIAISDKDWLAPPTDVLAAYDEYLLGSYQWWQYTPDSTRRAIEHLERAVELDPDFAEAFAALGTLYLMAGSHQGFLAPDVARPKARKALLNAVTLDPGLVTAQESLGDYYNCIERQPLLARRAFDSAFAVNPYLATSGHTRLLLLHDEREAALERIEQNLARYPDSVWQQLVAAQHFLAAGALERALELAERALAGAPGMDEAVLTRSRVLSELGEHERALADLEPLLAAKPDSTRIAVLTVVALARAGRVDEAAALFSTATQGGHRLAETHLAIANAWLGNVDAAFEHLEAALAQREFGLCYVAVEPVYAPLRADPRFDEIVRRMRGG